MHQLFRGGCLGAAEEGGRDWRAGCIHGDVEPCRRFIIVGCRGEGVCASPTKIVPITCRAAVKVLVAGRKRRFIDGGVGRWIAF